MAFVVIPTTRRFRSRQDELLPAAREVIMSSTFLNNLEVVGLGVLVILTNFAKQLKAIC
jgi:hypothetical protein